MMKTGWQPGMSLKQMEKWIILEAFRFYHGVKARTADGLGISVRTLDAKLEEYEQSKLTDDLRGSEQRERDESLLRRMRGLPPVLQTEGRNAVEPVAYAAQKPAVPMREREEVQEVSPKQAASGGSRKGR